MASSSNGGRDLWKKDARAARSRIRGEEASSSKSMQVFPMVEEAGLIMPPYPLKILSWNCRGIGHFKTYYGLKAPLKNHKPQRVFLMKTKGSYDKSQAFCTRLGFSKCIISSAVDNAEDLIFCWNKEVNLQLEWKNDRNICLLFLNVLGSKI